MPQLDNINQSFKSARMKINAFLRRQRWKEALIFFFFVLLSLGFWLLQSLQQEYEIEINIPVRYKNIPPDISFTETPPQEVIAKVKDKGSVLLNYSFGRSFAPIETNMKSGSLSIAKKAIENDIQKQLLATTSLVGFEPQHIEAPYSKRIKKDIPVVFNGTIQTNPGFHVSGNITISPMNISVYASDVVLDTLNQAKTVFTEKTLEIPVLCTDLPSHYTLRTFPSVAKVTCSIPLSRFKDLSEDAFEIKFSFKDLEQNVSGTLPIQLTKKPDWVTTTTLVPNKIEFILEQNNLQ